jgi:hypothetical protein
MKHQIGVIINKKVLPLVGYRGEHGDELTAAMELYYSSDWGVTLLQQRTPIIQVHILSITFLGAPTL